MDRGADEHRRRTRRAVSIRLRLRRPARPFAEGKRMLVSRVTSAVARACDLRAEVVSLPSGKRVSTRWVLSFFREVALDLAALDDLMAFENPMVLESVEGKP